ncbi:AAA family ATPase [Singulisphaera sp. PoT]|uniref:AAA family ATPase n=1 Tax=Singulisphaera sp. PoT TaxID=3411797 RepID=UPI003BF5CFA4
MSTIKILNHATLLHHILDWSSSRPPWQRDALRRIIVNGAIAHADITQLEAICLARHGINEVGASAPACEHLSADHLPLTSASTSDVTLVSLEKLENVNRLPSDQCLSFGEGPGITVIYGENGVGKSGYARVIKNACKTRGGRAAIRPNALLDGSTSQASASIRYRVDGAERAVTWLDGADPDAHLANVFVFDTQAARHYLDEDGPTSFTPRGLEILPTLGSVADAIAANIGDEIRRLDAQISACFASWKPVPGKQVPGLLANLAATTDPSAVEGLARKGADDDSRLVQLNEALRPDARHHAKTLRAAAGRIRDFASRMQDAARDLGDERCLALRTLLEAAAATSLAAEAFTSGAFDASYLPGTGGDAWRILWDAARSFAADHAPAGQAYPPAEEGARCVLCQQPMATQALDRLAAFDDYCRNRSLRQAEEMAIALREAENRIARLLSLRGELTSIDADLSPLGQPDREAIESFVAAHDLRLSALNASLATRKWAAPPPLPSPPKLALAALAGKLEERATVEESAEDPAELAEMSGERDELLGRAWLSDHLEEVQEQLARMKRRAALEKCKSDTRTKAITDKNSELTAAIVTTAFRARFAEEVSGLGLRTLSLAMNDISGRKGHSNFGVRLAESKMPRLRDIASEGEQRCIALAIFLAELSQATHASALVFDDPVSSVDHRHRERIARRLVSEAQLRQVIVFTHDTVFLNDIVSLAKRLKIPCECRHIEWNGGRPGSCCEGLPWDMKSPQDRLDKLGKLKSELAKKWEPIPSEANAAGMREAYSLLRATVERIVEREALANVVFRYRDYIDLKSLAKVVAFGQQEYDEIRRLFDRCSDVTGAHDEAAGKDRPVPDPAELARDIEDTRSLLQRIRAIHNGNQPAAATPLKIAGNS